MPTLLPLAAALAKAAWRGWKARPFLAVLNILGLAIGIAVYLAIQIVNHSATRTFRAGIDLVAGRSDLEITAPHGVPESVWIALQDLPGITGKTPVVEGFATLPSQPGEYLRIFGTDPFTAGPFFEAVEGGAAGSWENNTEAWLATPSSLVVNSAWAAKRGIAPGQDLTLSLQGVATPVRIASTFPAPEGRPDAIRTAFLDIGWAQELLGKQGVLSSIQIIAQDSTKSAALADSILPLLPAGVQVQPPAQRNRQVSLMLQGFQLNLTALSLVSLLVGVFLIGNTISASVVRQRREIGILRAIGASRTQVRIVFLAEAAFSAALGGLLGVPLARVIASGLLDGVSRTISTHYVLMSIDRLWISPLDVAQALGCGLLAALAGAWLPAREASSVDPVAVLRPGRHVPPRQIPWLKSLVPGLLFLVVCGALSLQALGSGPAWLSFGSCLALVLGFVFLARPAARLTSAVVEWAIRPWPALLLVRMGTSNLSRSLHRAVPVIAALMTSVAMVLGVTIMIHSFRSTLTLWIDATLKADLYIAPASNEVIKRSAVLPQDLLTSLAGNPAVSHVETLREERVAVVGGGEYSLRAVSRGRDQPLAYTGTDAQAQDQAWRLPDKVAISEILANRLLWKIGTQVMLQTPSGPVPFTVSGIFYDYADDQGCFCLTVENLRRHWEDASPHAAAVFLRDPQAAGELAESVRARFETRLPLSIYQNQALRTRVFEIFDETFAVTELLRVIAVAVALLGITLALSTLVAERAWDIAALRSIGASPGQVAALHLGEAAMIGWISACLGMICGLLLSMILTWVVNKAFFGWTVRFAVPWLEWSLTPLWVTAVALLAGWIPAWKAARTSPAEGLRSE